MSEPVKKNQWSQPQLTVLGDVETLTQQKVKNFGGNDGFTLESTTISG